VFPEETHIAICLIFTLAVNAFENIHTRFTFLGLEFRRISVIISRP